MILDYLRLRRLGLKHDVAADISNLDSLTRNLKAGVSTIAALLALLWVHGWVLERDMADEQAQQSSAGAHTMKAREERGSCSAC